MCIRDSSCSLQVQSLHKFNSLFSWTFNNESWAEFDCLWHTLLVYSWLCMKHLHATQLLKIIPPGLPHTMLIQPISILTYGNRLVYPISTQLHNKLGVKEEHLGYSYHGRLHLYRRIHYTVYINQYPACFSIFPKEVWQGQKVMDLISAANIHFCDSF